MKTQVSIHVSEARRIRRSARQMKALPAVYAKYMDMARDQMLFARVCKQKSL